MKTILFFWLGTLEPERGGIPRVTYLLKKGLEARGYRCLNIVGANDYSCLYTDNRVCNETALAWDDFAAWINRESVDVVINQDAYGTYFSSWWQRNKVEGVKYVTVFHSSPRMYHYEYSWHRLWHDWIRGDKVLRKWCLSRMLLYPYWRERALGKVMSYNRINYEVCDRYVLLSDRFVPVFAALSGLRESSKCVSIGNPLSFADICDEMVLETKKKTVLVVCRLNESQKRVSITLRLWSKLCKKYPDWQLRIVGHGPEEEYYKKLARDLNLSNITFTGRKESYEEYLDASIFLMTSAYEGWGLTLTESLQTGVVPVAMDSYESLHDMIENGRNGVIVKNNDIKAFIAAVEDLMTNKEKREELAKNGLKSAERFTLDKTLDKWIQLIENM